MARRRRRGGIEDLIGPVAALVFLLVFWAAGFNVNRATQMLQGLLALLVFGVIGIGVAVVIFLVIRHLIRKKKAGNAFSSADFRSPQANRDAPPAPGGCWQPLQRGADDLRASVRTPTSPNSCDFIERVRSTDWYQFEKVVGLIYQSQGYRVTQRGGANPDGGIDLIIEKDGVRSAVQCKRWKKWRVDVPKVRELIGAMTHEGLAHGVIVALNGFTLEAKQLAIEHNIDIVHDRKLGAMFAGLSSADRLKVQAMLDNNTKHCPKCEAPMIWRAPKPGKKAFMPFWGCSRYPQCNGRLQED